MNYGFTRFLSLVALYGCYEGMHTVHAFASGNVITYRTIIYIHTYACACTHADAHTHTRKHTLEYHTHTHPH